MSMLLPLPDPTGPPDGVLDRIAAILDSVVAEDDRGLLVGLSLGDDGVDLHHRPLEAHPAVVLPGFTAPDDWWAFGVAVTGSARVLSSERRRDAPATPAELADDAHGPSPVRIVHLVTRDGDVTSRSVLTGATDGRTTTEPTVGLIPDLCLRVLGLPTAPGPSSNELHAREWLISVLDLLDGAPVDPPWDALAREHPVVARVQAADPSMAVIAVERLDVAGRAYGRAWPWSRLRTAWAESGGAFGLTPDELCWMDDGLLARWCLSTYPDIDDLLDAVSALLPTAKARRIAGLVAGWGLPEPDPWRFDDRDRVGASAPTTGR